MTLESQPSAGGLGHVPEGEIRVRRAVDYSLREISDLFTRGFEGYFVPIHMTAEKLAWMIRADSIDLAASRVLTLDGDAAGFILVCSRGWSRRVSAMGVVSGGRGHGLGRHLLLEILKDAADGGYRKCWLEVLDRNVQAIRLYRHLGFREVRRLVGYERAAQRAEQPSSDLLKQLDARELAKILEYEAPPDLPWQLAAETVAAAGPPSIALRLEDKAYCLVSELSEDAGTIQCLVVPHTLRRQGWGARLVRALYWHYPRRAWRIPVRLPENLAPEFFLETGFTPIPMTQFEMVRDLP